MRVHLCGRLADEDVMNYIPICLLVL
ncbi:uncharacterized protein FTOL_13822 [Fusarium torulosum]|uniref:Uncharacterized protein n=1 Tax=Fusarium torulosum TaxID=33205 RepID=A0AAE8MP87_9HYPO|nr:uncharacterized protein FTOL_13822 [Fusarium torulosum]